MDNLNLESDESVIHTTPRIILNGISQKCILTDRRLILVDRDSGSPRVEIPFAEIDLAAAETNRLREPVIRISYSTPDGSARAIELIFIYQVGSRNLQYRDKCIAVLQERGVPVRLPPLGAFRSLNRKESMNAGTLVPDESETRPAAPEWTIYGTSSANKSLTDEPPEISPVVTIIAGIIIAAMIIWAMTMPIGEPRQPSYMSPKVTVSPTIALTPVPTAVATIQPVATSLTDTPLQPGDVPGNGFWVRISYPGEYTGFLSAGGWRKDVGGSGTQLFQMPVQDTVIDGFIEKGDGSGDTLTVEVYNGGIQLSKHETSKPHGLVEMHVAVGAPVIGTPAPALSSIAPVITPEPAATPASYAIPATGVWAKISYPGNYTGTIRTNGMQRDVTGSGNQFIQLVIGSGTIDTFIEKDDGSATPLSLEIYKDAILLDHGTTSAPRGTVEMHTVV